MPIEQKTPSEELKVDDRYDAYKIYYDYLENAVADPQSKFGNAKKYFEDFLQKNDLTLGEIGRYEAAEFISYLKSSRIKEKTAVGYINNINDFFKFLNQAGVLEWNPIGLEYSPTRFDPEGDPGRLHVPINELRDNIRDIHNPTDYTEFFLALKTGARTGERYNLDLRDINIDHPISTYMPEPRPEIENKPDTLFIDSEIEKGEVYNGQVRKAANKRKAKTIMPIDSELKSVLVWYIGLIPESPSQIPCEPLFRHVGNGGSISPGRRRGPETFASRLREFAEKKGWRTDMDNMKGVDPSWARHWFTTQLRNRISQEDLKGEQTSQPVKSYLKGLRGDIGSDVIDTYTHNWENEPWVRNAYLENIPKLLV